MKKSRYTDSQIMAILKQAEAGTPIPELCREHDMNSASFYKWRAKYGGMDASLMARMKELEEVQDYATRWLWFYNHERPHKANGGRPPMKAS